MCLIPLNGFNISMTLTINDEFERCERVIQIVIEEEEFANNVELHASMLLAFKTIYGDLKRKPEIARA